MLSWLTKRTYKIIILTCVMVAWERYGMPDKHVEQATVFSSFVTVLCALQVHAKPFLGPRVPSTGCSKVCRWLPWYGILCRDSS
jgi:hypothetical protein